MFQKGTGERFKYKAAVQEKFPVAKCRKRSYQNNITVYIVTTSLKELSSPKRSAEDAWADAYNKHVNL